MASTTSGEPRLAKAAAQAVRTQILLHGGNEVCFVCTVDKDGMLATARKVAAGDVQSVLALPGVAERGQMLLHNHPSGELTPSEADLEVAWRLHQNGVGFAICDNGATRVYVVTEIPTQRERVPLAIEAIHETLGPDGPIAAVMRGVGNGTLSARGYEDRPSQRDMAAEVAQRYNRGGVALL